MRNAVEHGSTSNRTRSDDAVERGSTDPDPLARRNSVERGGGEVTVTIRELDEVEGFYVEDDGPGIPENEREAVFDEGCSTRADGTGFGLAIITDILDAQGWNLAIARSEDGGTRIEISGVDFR